MTAQQNPPETAWRPEANQDAGMARQQTRAAKDLAIGDIVQVDGLEDDQVVRKAKRIREGLDGGLLHVTLVARDGDVERIALAPEERVTFVGKAPEGEKGQSGSPGKAKGQAKTKGRSQRKTVTAPAPQAAETQAAHTEPRTSNVRDAQTAKSEKKMRCVDPVGQLLTETGRPMTSQELIAALAAKGCAPFGPEEVGMQPLLPTRATPGDGVRAHLLVRPNPASRAPGGGRDESAASQAGAPEAPGDMPDLLEKAAFSRYCLELVPPAR